MENGTAKHLYLMCVHDADIAGKHCVEFRMVRLIRSAVRIFARNVEQKENQNRKGDDYYVSIKYYF